MATAQEILQLVKAQKAQKANHNAGKVTLQPVAIPVYEEPTTGTFETHKLLYLNFLSKIIVYQLFETKIPSKAWRTLKWNLAPMYVNKALTTGTPWCAELVSVLSLYAISMQNLLSLQTLVAGLPVADAKYLAELITNYRRNNNASDRLDGSIST